MSSGSAREAVFFPALRRSTEPLPFLLVEDLGLVEGSSAHHGRVELTDPVLREIDGNPPVRQRPHRGCYAFDPPPLNDSVLRLARAAGRGAGSLVQAAAAKHSVASEPFRVLESVVLDRRTSRWGRCALFSPGSLQGDPGGLSPTVPAKRWLRPRPAR